MRHLIRSSILVLIAFLLLIASAHGRPRNYASLSIGKTNTDDGLFYYRELESGTNMGAAIGFDVAPYTGMEMLFEQHWSKKTSTGDQFKLKMIILNLKFRPVIIRDRYSPYVMIGGGYVRGSYGWMTQNGDGYFYGIGSEIWILPKLGFFIEWKTGTVKLGDYDGDGSVIKFGVLAGF